jgi:hypothetical protein
MTSLSPRSWFKFITRRNKNTSRAVLCCGENTKRNISTEEIDSQSYNKKSQGRSLIASQATRTNPGCIIPRAARILALRFVPIVPPFPGSGRTHA